MYSPFRSIRVVVMANKIGQKMCAKCLHAVLAAVCPMLERRGLACDLGMRVCAK